MEYKTQKDIACKYKREIEHWADTEYSDNDVIEAIKEGQKYILDFLTEEFENKYSIYIDKSELTEIINDVKKFI